MARLRRTTVKVHANISEVIMYSFASPIIVPIVSGGMAMISAATPAFHARPRELLQAERKYGLTEGI